jgi:hypothetical protein
VADNEIQNSQARLRSHNQFLEQERAEARQQQQVYQNRVEERNFQNKPTTQQQL